MKFVRAGIPAAATVLALTLAAPARGQDPGRMRLNCPGRYPCGRYGPGPVDPFEELEEMRRMMDRLFTDTYGMDYGYTAGPMAEPSLDVQETESEVIVTCDLPGMDKEKIDISLQDNVLTISGERERIEEVKDDSSSYYRSERVFGSFHRSILLPSVVDEKDVTAEYKDGVLTVVLKKLEPEKPEGVRIKVL